jgi:hypothetical protein
MGIHDKSFELLEWFFTIYKPKSVLELGSQNFYHNYHSAKYGDYADKYYVLKGIDKYACIDLNEENGAMKLDLSKPIAYFGEFDLVTDFGTSEHIAPYDSDDNYRDNCNDIWTRSVTGVEALYNCWKTKYNASSKFIISANPATGHWIKHGHFYYTLDFYRVLAELTGMKILKLQEQYAMHNYVDGKEIACVLDITDSHWISLDEFKKAFIHIHSN